MQRALQRGRAGCIARLHSNLTNKLLSRRTNDEMGLHFQLGTFSFRQFWFLSKRIIKNSVAT
jgi:hypothetical protein